ncbi:MAG TPA: alpha/beta hydrolase [Chitinophagaceae bacterium]|nr:alpha/beta hydrolase [Chitinophagaceae bacterium]
MDKEIRVDNRRLFYRSRGEGPVLVLVHGFGEDGRVWAGQAGPLADRYRVIVPDLPGSGRSDLMPGAAIEDLADQVHILLERELGTRQDLLNERVILVGHSLGGYIALAYAERYPDSLLGLGLFHSTAYPDSEEKIAVRRRGIDLIREYGAAAFLKTSSPGLFSPLTRERRPGLVEEFLAGQSNFSAEALVCYYEAMIRRPDRRNILQRAAVPVLFVAGKSDGAVPLRQSLEQGHLAAISYFHILKESGHMGMLEEPGKSRDILDAFCRGSAHI